MTSIKYDHLQVMATISGKFHQNPLKSAETRTSVDKMAKTDKGPELWLKAVKLDLGII